MNYLNKYIKNNKIDLFEVIFNNFKKTRIVLKTDFISFIRKKSVEKFNSTYRLAQKVNIKTNESYHYSPLQRYLTSCNYRTSIPIYLLIKITELLGIQKNKIYNNIEYFQSWTGKKIFILRYLKVDRDFIYGIGLYLGEGKNTDKKKQRVGIANSKKEIIKFSIYWFNKYFNINKNELKFYTISPNNCNNQELKKDLIKEFNLINNDFSMGNRERTNVSTIQVYYDSVIIRNLIDWLKENTIPSCLKDKKLGIRFFQGIMDGEGSVSISNVKRSIKLVLEMKNKLVLNTVRFILYKQNVETKQPLYNKDLIYTTSTKDYFKLKEIQPFRFNLKNKKKFNHAEKIIKRFQTKRNGLFYESLSLLSNNKKEFFTLDNLYNLLGRKGRANIHLIFAINKAIKLELIKRKGKGVRGNPYKHKITEKGIMYSKNYDISRINEYNTIKSDIDNFIQNRWKNGS